jgi:hypothetical protein
VDVVSEAAVCLEVARPERERIKAALESLRKPLSALAAAGVLSGVTLTLQDAAGTVRMDVVFDAFDVGDGEDVDLSRLKLLASPQGEGRLEVMCSDEPLGRRLVETVLLPSLSEEALTCCQVRWQGRGGEPGGRAEAIENRMDDLNDMEGGFDEYDDFGASGGGSGDEIDHLRD